MKVRAGEMTESRPSKVPKNWLRHVTISIWHVYQQTTKKEHTSKSRSFEFMEVGKGVPSMAKSSFSATSFARPWPTAFSRKYLEAFQVSQLTREKRYHCEDIDGFSEVESLVRSGKFCHALLEQDC